MSDGLREAVAKLDPEKRAILAGMLRPDPEPIAVIGIGCRFPGGVYTAEAFWELLRDGRDGRIEVPAERWDVGTFYDPDPSVPDKAYTRLGNFLPDLSLFDADFFGLSPREAVRTDPQQRLLLETTWQALENAGQAVSHLAGSATGVFIGITNAQFVLRQLLADPSFFRDPFSGIGSDCSAAVGRLSYTFDLQGPNISVDTACSSSLIALHLACQSLRNQECDMAVTGGVYAIAVPHTLVIGCRMGMLAVDGRCKTFDARADGFGLGEGCGIVVLKRLKDALAADDTVLAVIRGSAVNEDGRSNGLTAPNGLAQQNVIRQALANARLDPHLISYVEAHGTGTALGDPIEVEAVQAVLNKNRSAEHPLFISTVKTNIGHLYASAGIAGFIKTVLALQHKTFPPHLHLQERNPNIDWDETRLQIPTELTSWKPIEGRRIAGVSSFGWSGSNAHVIVEEPPLPSPAETQKPYHLLPLSAQTATALETVAINLHDYWLKNPGLSLSDVGYTLQNGRQLFSHRRALVCRDRDDALQQLAGDGPTRQFDSSQVTGNRRVTFMFSGVTEPRPDTTRELYDHEPLFRDSVDHCCTLLQPLLALDLRQLLYPAHENAASPSQIEVEAAVFVVNYSLAQLLQGWGIRPDALIGFGLGEYVAACVAGVLSVADALRLVVERAGMGPAGQLRELVSGFQLNPPHTPCLSNVTGDWITAAQATDPGYWAQHIVQPARFSNVLVELLRDKAQLLLEVGPGNTWRSLARLYPDYNQEQMARVLRTLPAAGEKRSELAYLLESVGKLWLLDVRPDWPALHAGESRRRVPLPTYPFERQRYWVEPTNRLAARQDAPATPPAPVLNGQATATADLIATLPRRSIDDWFYLPGWQQMAPRRPSLPEAAADGAMWLLFIDKGDWGRQINAWLAQQQQNVVLVEAGPSFQQLDEGHFMIRPSQRADYDALLQAVHQRGWRPSRIVHLWNTTTGGCQAQGRDALAHNLNRGFYSLIYLAQALKDHELADCGLFVVSSEVQSVTAGDTVCPVKATLLGPGRAIPLEYAGVNVRAIDIGLTTPGSWQVEALQTHLLGELTAADDEPVVALRDHQRWVQTFTPCRLPAARPGKSVLRPNGTYLITGGLGGVGMGVAEYLAKTVGANLLLTGRSPIPERRQWPRLLSTDDNPDLVRKIRRIEQLEALGARVVTVAADVTDEQQMKAAVAEAMDRFGVLHGVLHAAGTPGMGLIQLKTAEAAAAVLAPKVAGTLVLERALQGVELDFLLLFSSLASFAAGGPGQVDYAAANAFLDAYAHSCSHKKRLTTAVNWGEWEWNGWAEGLTGFTPEVQQFFKDNRSQFGIKFEEGGEALERILSCHAPQVVVSTRELIPLLDYSRQLTTAHLLDRRRSPPVAYHPRPILGATYIAPRNELESAITAVWSETLGIAEIGIDDNFFDLGGNSLLGLELVRRLQKTLGIPNFPARILFEAPSVRLLAQLFNNERQSVTLVAAQHARGEKRRRLYAAQKRGRI